MSNYWVNRNSLTFSRRRLLKTSSAALSGVAAISLLGCSGDDNDSNGGTSSNGSTSAGEPKQGGRFGTTSGNLPTNFNPISNFSEGNYLSGLLVYDRPITTRMDKRQYVLEAAEKVEVPDATRVVFTLKPNLVYQNIAPVNGRPVKTSDIAAVQEYVRGLSNAYEAGFVRTFVSKVEATDDRTVVFHLNKPFAYVFSAATLTNPNAMPIIPQELLANLDTTKPIGSGPYTAEEYNLGVRWTFKRSATFRDASKGLPYIDEREFLAISDPVAVEAALRSEQTHEWWRTPPSTAKRIAAEASDKLIDETALGPGLNDWNMNMNKPFWQDVRVREAFYRAINRQQILDLAYQGEGVVIPGCVPAALEEYQLDAKDTAAYFRNDIAEAKKLLAAANWDSSKEIEILTYTSSQNESIVQTMQQNLEAVGLKARPISVPTADMIKRMTTGDYEVFAGGHPGGDTPYRVLRQHHTQQIDALAHMGLKNPTIDALIEKSEATVDHQENVKLVREIQLETLKLYAGSCPILSDKYHVLRSSKLQGFELDVLLGQLTRTNMWFSS